MKKYFALLAVPFLLAACQASVMENDATEPTDEAPAAMEDDAAAVEADAEVVVEEEAAQ